VGARLTNEVGTDAVGKVSVTGLAPIAGAGAGLSVVARAGWVLTAGVGLTRSVRAMGVRDLSVLCLTLALGVHISPALRDVVRTLLISSAPSFLTVRAVSFSAVCTAQGATSLLDGAVVGLGGVQSGLVGVGGAALGPIKRVGGSFDPLRHSFALGLVSDIVARGLLALGAAPMIEAASGARSTNGTGMGPSDSSTSVAQSNGVDR
jgi:hypothetical protein